MAPTKRQTTMAKIAREQALRERRARKQQKKDDRKAALLPVDGAVDSAHDRAPGDRRAGAPSPHALNSR